MTTTNTKLGPERGTAARRQPEASDAARVAKRKVLALQSARILSWKSVLVESLGRELHALHIQQQERAFMATSHGLNYVARQRETTVVH
ncbi:hypothetical protein [Pelagibius sp. 7325]|uniref:hypothetical protein n=1 Tax=Pelagibius sp. 7325 TaxID=3131994 RepID=UPI0030EB6A30